MGRGEVQGPYEAFWGDVSRGKTTGGFVRIDNEPRGGFLRDIYVS